MSSDTPRTDEEVFSLSSKELEDGADGQNLVYADFARQLERELAAVTAERDALQARLNWAANELLACDYGDNHLDGAVVGWIVYGWRNDTWRLPHWDKPRIYGASIDAAIDAAREGKA